MDGDIGGMRRQSRAPDGEIASLVSSYSKGAENLCILASLLNRNISHQVICRISSDYVNQPITQMANSPDAILSCQLVKQQVNLEFQLASTKGKICCGCTSIFCFSRAPAGINGTSPPRLDPVHHSETSSDSFTSNSSDESIIDEAVDDGERKTCLRSSLKKPLKSSTLAAQTVDKNDSIINELPRRTPGFPKRRNIQWTDACGKELVEIREFECSEDDLSDEYAHDGDKCHCVIQ